MISASTWTELDSMATSITAQGPLPNTSPSDDEHDRSGHVESLQPARNDDQPNSMTTRTSVSVIRSMTSQVAVPLEGAEAWVPQMGGR